MAESSSSNWVDGDGCSWLAAWVRRMGRAALLEPKTGEAVSIHDYIRPTMTGGKERVVGRTLSFIAAGCFTQLEEVRF